MSYGGIEAIKNISFDVEEGKIVTLIGSNGAGKKLDASLNCRNRPCAERRGAF